MNCDNFDKIQNNIHLYDEIELQNLIRELITGIKNVHADNLMLNTKLENYVFNINKFNSKDEIINLKYPLSKLKMICKENKLNTFGNKDELIDRIWCLKNPDKMSTDSFVKKRGRKTVKDRVITNKKTTNKIGPRCLKLDNKESMEEIYIGLYDYKIYKSIKKYTVTYYKDDKDKVYTIRDNLLYHIGIIKNSNFMNI